MLEKSNRTEQNAYLTYLELGAIFSYEFVNEKL